KNDNIVVTCFGDTVLEEGIFHESMNFASLHKLRVIFFCENNFYSIFSPLKNRQPERPLTDVAKAHNMKACFIDSSNVFEAAKAMKPVVDDVRNNEYPIFLEVKTYRYVEHCGPNSDEHIKFRPEGELEFWKARDPLGIAMAELSRLGYWSDEWHDDMEQKIKEEISSAFEFSINSPYPAKEELGAFTYAK
ncbi:MAG: thiamine pyrophosphate-dependent dehydrogenase E1 component subunit alpha, partial [Oligoflexales bacterium]|nr:thiamine pyrophosphate-dependent dehydrogenase E1 component subunit alpha [Oligoflexales bacterium]